MRNPLKLKKIIILFFIFNFVFCILQTSLYADYASYQDFPDTQNGVNGSAGFWRHNYVNAYVTYLGSTVPVTHTGIDYHVNYGSGVHDAPDLIKSYGFGQIEATNRNLGLVSIKNLLNSGDRVNFQLMHMTQATTNTWENQLGNWIAKEQIIGEEGSTSATNTHLHVEASFPGTLTSAWVPTINACPGLAGGNCNSYDNHIAGLDLDAHYDWTKTDTNRITWYDPKILFTDYKELLPYISTEMNPSPTQYKVYGHAGTPLYSSLILNRTNPSHFRSIGIVVGRGHDRNAPTFLDLSKGKWLASSWDLDSDNNGISDVDWSSSTITSVEIGQLTSYTGSYSYPAGNYQCKAFVNKEGTSTGADQRGYPITFTILPDGQSKIIDNDQMNIENVGIYTDAMGTTQDPNVVPGYYLTAKLAKGLSGASANWKPYLLGKFEVYVYVPAGATATNVVYKLKPDGTDATQVLSQGVDQTNIENQNNWVKLMGVNGESIFNFSRNGYVGVSLTSGSNPGLDVNTEVAFDAVKFIRVKSITQMKSITQIMSFLLEETSDAPPYGLMEINDIVHGNLKYTDESDHELTIPNDMWVRIVPSSLQNDASGWEGPKCKINADGSFGNPCFIRTHEKATEDIIRRAFSNSTETYQVIVFQNHLNTHEYNWDCGEAIYKYVGGILELNDWNNIEVKTTDFHPSDTTGCPGY